MHLNCTKYYVDEKTKFISIGTWAFCIYSDVSELLLTKNLSILDFFGLNIKKLYLSGSHNSIKLKTATKQVSNLAR